MAHAGQAAAPAAMIVAVVGSTRAFAGGSAAFVDTRVRCAASLVVAVPLETGRTGAIVVLDDAISLSATVLQSGGRILVSAETGDSRTLFGVVAQAMHTFAVVGAALGLVVCEETARASLVSSLAETDHLGRLRRLSKRVLGEKNHRDQSDELHL